MTEIRGVTIVTTEDQLRSASPIAWEADRRLGLTADRTRVVDYYSTEAAYLFKAPGKKITAEEAERYGISRENPLSPRPGKAPVAPPQLATAEVEAETPPPDEPAEEKAEPKSEDKAAEKPANKGGLLRRGKGK